MSVRVKDEVPPCRRRANWSSVTTRRRFACLVLETGVAVSGENKTQGEVVVKKMRDDG